MTSIVRFPADLERQVLQQIRAAPTEHVAFPGREFRDGHIVIYRDNLGVSLHRYLYEAIFPGELRRGLFLRRGCSNERCVNPYHYDVTRRTRPLDEKCRNGHRWTKTNTVHPPSGGRRCRACAEDRNARRRKTKRRAGYCIHGHELTNENTYWWTDAKGRNHRRCRQCKKIMQREYRARLREEAANG